MLYTGTLTLFLINFTVCKILTTSSLSQEYGDFESISDRIKCLDLAQNFTSVTLIFCKLEPNDLIVKGLISKNIPIYIIASNNDYNMSGHLSSTYNQKRFPNFIVFSGSSNSQDTGECILSNIHNGVLTSKANVIICDVSDGSTSPSLEPDAWSTVGSANVLYIAKPHCWTLSPPYVFERRFTHVLGCKGLEDFWRSDQHLPNLRGQQVKAVSFHRPITTIINENETDSEKRYDGVEMNIFKVIAQQLNFTWRLNELGNETDKWGQLRGGCWKGGIMEALTSGGAQVGFATIWMSPRQVPYLDYTTSWMSIETILLVPKPVLVDNSFSSLLRPFSSPVWVGVSAALLLFPLTLWTSLRLHLRLFPTARNSVFSVIQCFLYTLGTITGGSGRLGDGGRHRPAARPLVSCWYLFALLLCNSYNSNIVADLTLPLFTPKINTVRQLVEQGFSWGRIYQEDTLDKYLDYQNYWHRRFAEKFIVYNKAEEKRLILTRKFAHSAQQIKGTNNIILDTPLEEDLAGMLRVMKELLRSYRCAIAVRKNSPLLASMNTVVSRMIESGLVQYIKDDSVRRYQNPAYDKIYLDINTGFTSDTSALTINHYKYMFFMLFIGWSLASLCFILEIFIHAFYGHRID